MYADCFLSEEFKITIGAVTTDHQVLCIQDCRDHEHGNHKPCDQPRRVLRARPCVPTDTVLRVDCGISDGQDSVVTRDVRHALSRRVTLPSVNKCSIEITTLYTSSKRWGVYDGLDGCSIECEI